MGMMSLLGRGGRLRGRLRRGDGGDNYYCGDEGHDDMGHDRRI